MINKELKRYIENNIIPKYEKLDKAHRSDHVIKVIEESLEIAKDYDVDSELVYVIAAFHDLGLMVERERHHIIGGVMLENDVFIKNMFTIEEIIIMKEAVEDHRASKDNPPRTIYGSIIAEADKVDDMRGVIERCFKYALSKEGALDFETSFPLVHAHLIDKYGKDGYLKTWLKTKSVDKMLEDIRELLKDPLAVKEYCYDVYNSITNN